MGILVMAIRFACELAALAAIAWFGAVRANVALAIALPLAVVVVWGLWVAPRARRRLRDPLRFVVESVVWSGAVAALVLVDHVALAIGFGAVAFATALLARRFEPAVVGAS